MLRIDTVAEALQGQAGKAGVTAGELAQFLGLARANVSGDLNKLCRAGRARKTEGRPTRYFPTDTTTVSSTSEEAAAPVVAGDGLPADSSRPAQEASLEAPQDDLLEQFARENPSMYRCVELAKAAVLYPPNGMHVLINGATGVGKSWFAKVIYEYAVGCGALPEQAPFVSFNCADYADNPQLLVSELMGTRKGAYTGADEDRPGLLEKADGGMLFLDEVHRLPPQGQEMLFTYMDRGVFRRLGDVESEKTAQVRLICATTEDPDSSLLATFTRRIPVVLRIPSLAERSPEERFRLIAFFFVDESKRLGSPIEVSTNAVRALLGYSCPANVGQLKNDIKIICARAYAQMVGGRRRALRITSRDLPANIAQGLYTETSRRQVWRGYLSSNRRFCTFDARRDEPDASSQLYGAPGDESIYDLLDFRLAALAREHATDEEREAAVNAEIERYFDQYRKPGVQDGSLASVTNLVAPEYVEVTDQILALAQQRLGRPFSENVRYGLATHVASTVARLVDGLPIENPRLNAIRREHPQEFAFAVEAAQLVSRRFGVDVPLDEAGFIALFFCRDAKDVSAHPLVVVIAHGRSTASSMVETARELLGFDLALAIDAALSETPATVYERLLEEVRKRDYAQGVLLLVDMGSLTNFARDLQRDLGVEARALPLVSTMHVVEASLKASLGASLGDVYERARRVNEMLGAPDDVEPAPRKVGLARAFVVTVCTTGEGGAALLKGLLDSKLDYHAGFCETVPLAIASADELRRSLDSLARVGRVLCTVSAFEVDYPCVHLSFADIFAGSGISDVQELIEDELLAEHVDETLKDMLKNVDTSEMLPLCRKAIDSVEAAMGLKLLPGLTVGLLCHLGCLVDRTIAGEEPFAFENADEFVSAHRALYEAVAAALVPLERRYSIAFARDDVCYAMLFFADDNVQAVG